MSWELLFILAFNLIVNGLLVFVTAAFFCKSLLFLFHIKDSRIRSLFYLVPFLKLFFDFIFYYDFSNWALFHSIDPRLAAENSRTLSAYLGFFPWPVPGIHFFVGDDKLFTAADLLALYLGPQATALIVCVVIMISAFKLWRWIQKLVVANRTIQHLVDTAEDFRENVLISGLIDVPCAVGIFRRQILLPKNLVPQLSDGEIEAIVVHEKGHLFWHDPLVRLVVQVLSTTFWWIPTKRWRAALENYQEEACDAPCEPLDLASAIVKAARSERKLAVTPMVACFVQPSDAYRRVQKLLVKAEQQSKTSKWMKAIIALQLATMIFLGHFWIF